MKPILVLGLINLETTLPMVNTIGAADALFASFLHAYRHSSDPRRAAQGNGVCFV